MNDGIIKRDLVAGVLLAGLGLGIMADGSRHAIGTLSAMQAGYFPVLLGVLMTGIGVLIFAGGLLSRGQPSAKEPADALEALHPPDLRGCIAIILSVVAFVVLGSFLGLAPATFVAALIAAAGDRQTTVKGALALAVVLVVIAVVLFSYVLKVPFPLVRW